MKIYEVKTLKKVNDNVSLSKINSTLFVFMKLVKEE